MKFTQKLMSVIVLAGLCLPASEAIANERGASDSSMSGNSPQIQKKKKKKSKKKGKKQAAKKKSRNRY